jgi:hypothetical protein
MFPSQIRTAIQTLSERLVFLDELLKEPTLKEVRRAKINQARESVATEITKNQQELDRLDKAEEVKPIDSKLAQHAPTETTLNKAAETRITQASIGLDSELSDYINGLQSSLQRGPDTQDAKRVTAEIQYLQKMKDLIPTSPEQAQKGLNDLRAVKRIQAKEAAAAAQSTKIAAKSDSIRFPFNEWSRERLEKGSKTATARTYTFGRTGDTFSVGDKTYEITSVSKKSLAEVSQNYYLKEGAKSPEEYRQVWESLHPGGFKPSQTVYFHEFRELKPGAVPLIPVQQKTAEWFSSRGSILKESREESKGIVSLPRTVFGEKTVGVSRRSRVRCLYHEPQNNLRL